MTADKFSNKAEAFEAFDDTPLSPQTDDTIGAVIVAALQPPRHAQGQPGRHRRHRPFGEAALVGASGPAKAASAGFAFREVTARWTTSTVSPRATTPTSSSPGVTRCSTA